MQWLCLECAGVTGSYFDFDLNSVPWQRSLYYECSVVCLFSFDNQWGQLTLLGLLYDQFSHYSQVSNDLGLFGVSHCSGVDLVLIRMQEYFTFSNIKQS